MFVKAIKSQPYISCPKNQRLDLPMEGWMNLYETQGVFCLGPQDSHFWGVRNLTVGDFTTQLYADCDKPASSNTAAMNSKSDFSSRLRYRLTYQRVHQEDNETSNETRSGNIDFGSWRYPRSFFGFVELRSYILLILLGLAKSMLPCYPPWNSHFSPLKMDSVGILTFLLGWLIFRGVCCWFRGSYKCEWSDLEVVGCFEISFCWLVFFSALKNGRFKSKVLGNILKFRHFSEICLRWCFYGLYYGKTVKHHWTTI